MINEAKFYQLTRTPIFEGTISTSQFQGTQLILNEWKKRRLTDLRHLAYILATAFHETAHTMQPVEEYGRGRTRRYGKKIMQSGRIYVNPDKLYYGRGHVQLTWYENYVAMGKLLKLDLLNKPELALVPEVSIQILFEGMLDAVSKQGDFTGKSLEDYIPTGKPMTSAQLGKAFVECRRIINGVDKAVLIAGYAKVFYNALAA